MKTSFRFQNLQEQINQTAAGLSLAQPVGDGAIQAVAAPYRICPIGAHVDHQAGAVLGVAINAYTVLVFAPSADGMVRLTSADFAGEIAFSAVAPLFFVKDSAKDWGRYARGAVFALHKLFPNQITTGLTGHISGRLLGAGLSSSASAGVAYLMALSKVNDLTLTQAELVELDRVIENEYLGLNNGIQDQTTIVFGRADGIVHQDTRNRIVTAVPHPPQYKDVAWLVIFSGFTRELTSSGFNDRVAECWQAAGQLRPGAKLLGDVSPEHYLENRTELPQDLQRRAAHYFTETARVEQGKTAWAAGDFKRFGELMNRSCESSVHQYECGSEPLIKLHEIALQTAGVLGSRFSGGGYGGCLVALAQRDQAEGAIEQILKQYRLAYPQKADVCAGWLVDGVDGASTVIVSEQTG
ncbi:MAG: galacturonokinase [Cellvibrionaceae bacterium]|jgi:galacturonokinase